MLFMPQAVIGTHLRAPIPAISHFDILGLKPENSEEVSKVLTTSPIELSFFKRNVVSLVYAE